VTKFKIKQFLLVSLLKSGYIMLDK